jgi:hypothetical protein
MVHGMHGGSLASHRGRVTNQRPRGVVSPGRPGDVASHDVAAQRHVLPAEAAQARLFEAILRTQIAEMLNLPPHARADKRDRIAEVDRLIKALRHRFPPGPKTATPLPRDVQPTPDRAPRALLN